MIKKFKVTVEEVGNPDQEPITYVLTGIYIQEDRQVHNVYADAWCTDPIPMPARDSRVTITGKRVYSE